MELDRLFFVSCLCISIALILYVFHWNRFLGFFIGRFIRLLYWGQDASSTWIEIGSIHFSLIAGRILLKDFSYHSSNQTIRIVKGQIQWRYWIRRPISEGDIGLHPGGGEERSTAPSLQCRIHVSLQGFEWFLYNRTPAFDNIVSQMEAGTHVPRSTDRRQPSQKSFPVAPTGSFYPPPFSKTTLPIPSSVRNAIVWMKRQLPNLDPKDLLPLGLEVTKGAITCGNSSTTNLLVAEFQRTQGTFGIVESRSKFDLYKQLLSLNFESAVVRYVENEDYADSIASLGELVHGRIIQSSTIDRTSAYLSYRPFAKIWTRLNLLSIAQQYILRRRQHHAMRKQQTHPRPRQKARKSIDEPVSVDFTLLEYAIQRKILEAPLLELTYYFDVVGEVPAMSERVGGNRTELPDIGNGDLSPEWGFDLIVSGGFFRYGPWADRQRVELQRTFFPPTYRDVEVTPFLKCGDKRTWTEMRVLLELRDCTTLHIPFREPSKDWQWDGKSNPPQPQTQRVREPAAIHFSVGGRSTISYALPMVVGPFGYKPTLDVQFDSITVTSTLNDIRLVTADSGNVRCDLPAPLQWNGKRTWSISVSLHRPFLYLIRDHINMFTDLGKDWTTGPPSDYQRFIPMIYAFNLELHHYEFNMYANDHNIIDKPLIPDENALLTARGDYLKTKADILSNKYRPDSTTVPFKVEAPDISLSLSLPRWNTNALHAPRDGHNLARMRLLHTEGSYLYFSDIREEHIDQLNLRFTLHDVAYKALGWSIRYFVVLRENYFGSFTHFSTLYEYLDKRKRNLPPGDPIIAKYRQGKNNILQIGIKSFIENASIILTTGLPGYESCNLNENKTGIGACLVFKVTNVQSHLRLHDYYMDMSLNFGIVTGGVVTDYPERVTFLNFADTKDIIVIDGFDITANRLFGPQPKAAAYVCIWEIRLGSIKSLLTAYNARLITAAAKALRLNFTDLANAPANQYLPPSDPDVTFVKTTVSSVDITWIAGHAALVISLPHGVIFDTNDLGGQYHRKVATLRIPHISVKTLLTPSNATKDWLEAAEMTASIELDFYSSPRGYRKTNQDQITYIEEQDRLTGRARKMLGPLAFEGVHRKTTVHKDGLYLPQPILPAPQKHVKLKRPNSMRERPAKFRSPGVTRICDSDVEEGISEADRDARLAKTRTSTPIIRLDQAENENMSSGDESDDEDLTDGGSESDWSDFANTPGVEAEAPMFMHYLQITRRYTAQHLVSPILWQPSPFVLARDPVLHGLGPTHPRHPFTTESSDDFWQRLNISDDQDSSTFRFKCTRGVDLRITPLILLAVAHFEEDLRENPLGPELFIDSMLAIHLGSMSMSATADPRTLFDFFVPWVVVRVLQQVITLDSHPIPSGESTQPLNVIAVFQSSLHGVIASTIITKDNIEVKAIVDRLSCTLDISLDKRTVQPPGSHESLFSCIAEDARTTITQDSLDIAGKTAILRIGHRGPGYLLATCIALARNAKQFGVIIKRWKDHSSYLTQQIVADVIRLSGGNATFDPLSTIQPSYLIQSDTPHILRTDIIFRFLSHLRDSLRHLQLNQRDTWRSNTSQIAIDPDDFNSLLEARLVGLDLDAYNVAHLASLELFFPILRADKASSASGPKNTPISSISVRLTNTVIVILDASSASSNQLTITDLRAGMWIRHTEVLHLSSSNLAAMSQTSLNDKSIQGVKKSTVSISLGVVTLSMFPHLMSFAQRILHVRRSYHPKSATRHTQPASFGATTRDIPPSQSIDIVFSLHSLCIQAAAENLVFEFGLSNVRGTSSLLSPKNGSQRMNTSVLFHQIYIRAHSPSGLAKGSDQDILAAVELAEGRVNSVLRQDVSPNADLRLVFATDLQVHVPRSALRLYRFIEEWRADYLPGVEATIQALLSELHQVPMNKFTRTSSSSRSLTFQIQGKLSRIGISLQVMHGTWLSWEASSTIGYLNSSKLSTPGLEYTFGLQIGPMILSISTKPHPLDTEPKTRVKLVLPPISATGQYNGTTIHTVTLLEFVELKVKPSHWDTLLIVQQKFGQDFNDLVTLVQETQQRRSTPATLNPVDNRTSTIVHSSFMKIRGFRVGLEGPSSTIYLECLDISGGIDNRKEVAWKITLSDLAFSLTPYSAPCQHRLGFKKDHRSAFVIIDLEATAQRKHSEERAITAVQLSGTKIHAVIQPSSIGEIGDFIDHLQLEMLDHKNQRALELAAFEEKARSILKTFEVRMRDTHTVHRSWLEDYIVRISIRNVGFAFPLTHNLDLELPRSGSRDSTAVPAFLWSIKSIIFETHRGETGQATMNCFSFQFIPHFRQSVPGDFSSKNHQTRNMLLYPEMAAQLRSKRTASFRHIWIGANVSGFILDLDSNIPSYVFSLIDVYQRGKDRMEKLSTTIPRTPSSQVNAIRPEKEKEFDSESHYTSLPASNVFCSLVFLSGKVRVYSGSASNLYRSRYVHHHQEPSDEQVMELGVEVFNLPIVSVWAEYRAAPASQPLATSHLEPSTLMFKATVHSSQNALRPSLLPFLTELVSHVDRRLHKISLNDTSRPSLSSPSELPTIPMEHEHIESAVSSLRISFSLRIDQSKLELTCKPDVNVIAGLHWNSGGFVVNISPGARKVTFTGNVGGLTLGLKHGFLSEDCAKLDARNLAFSVTFAKVDSDQDLSLSSISVILDTEILGVVRFSRLQDILCFKAVWLDRIPMINSQPAVAVKIAPKVPTNTALQLRPRKEILDTAIIVRIRHVTLEVDLGQSICSVTLDLHDALVRTKLTGVRNEVSVFVTDLTIFAKGNIAGHAHVPNCVFQTVRNAESTPSDATERGRTMMELHLTSGPLIISLESDHQKLLHYRAAPLEVKVFDDWSMAPLHADAEERSLQLSFNVTGSEIIAVATVGTIPKLLAYVNKFQSNLDIQRQGASRESKTFRISHTPKPDNPLSAVAEAMLSSARRRFKEAEFELSYVIMQHMSLRLDFLRLIVFPRTMDDFEIAQFIGREVQARLTRFSESEPPLAKRDLLLSFSSMTISKFTGLGHPQKPDLTDGRNGLASLLDNSSEAIIVGLPSMSMHMVTEEMANDQVITLLYDFDSEFVRQEGNRELKDIYITLNVALYSWLTILRKNLTREMDQVKATTDRRTLMNIGSSNGGAARKKLPEPLSLVGPRSSTLPTPVVEPFSPFSPTTALKSSVPGPPGMLSATSSTLPSASPCAHTFPSLEAPEVKFVQRSHIIYQPRNRHIERLRMRQLGEATPDVMHPFFMKKAGFNLEDSLPQYVHEYATAPLEEIMEVLLKLYSRQLKK